MLIINVCGESIPWVSLKENGQGSKDASHGIVNLLRMLAATQQMHFSIDPHRLINKQHYRNNTIIINENEVKPRDLGNELLGNYDSFWT